MLHGQVIGLLIRGKTSLLNVAAIFGCCARNNFSDVSVAAREFRLVTEAQPEQIVNHQNLPIAIWSGANADRGNPQLGSDSCTEFPRNRFQNNGERACSFHSASIAQKLVARFFGLALHAESAKGVD